MFSQSTRFDQKVHAVLVYFWNYASIHWHPYLSLIHILIYFALVSERYHEFQWRFFTLYTSVKSKNILKYVFQNEHIHWILLLLLNVPLLYNPWKFKAMKYLFNSFLVVSEFRLYTRHYVISRSRNEKY